MFGVAGFRLAGAKVALDCGDFALRRRPHLGFGVAVKGDDPAALVGQRGAPPFAPP